MATKRGKQAFRGGERRAWPAWIWLALGIACGVILSIVVLYGGKLPTLRGKNLPQPNPEATAPKESEQALADDAKKQPPAPAKNNFDFYSVLPEKEVVIPDAELSAKAKAEQQRAQQQAAQDNGAAPATGAAATPTPQAEPGSGRYMLQVASVTDPKAADEFKARLAMLGFSAKIYQININGKVYNRVRLGPYATASETQAAQKALTENSIQSTPMKETN
jgi:cell division protein FtsN